MKTARIRTALLLGLAVLGINALPALAQASKPAAPAKDPTPSYSKVRWDEDYSYLKNGTSKPDMFDSIKYIPLGRDDFYLSLGGQVRERYEYFNNASFGVGTQDNDGFYLTRFTAHADLHLGQNFRFFVQGKSSLEDGREGGPRSSDRDEAELQQAFFDLILPFTENFKTTIRLGRQEVVYGTERVIGVSDWTNNRRNFEGVRVINEYKADNYANQLDVMFLRPTVTDIEGYNDGDDTQTLWGIYDSVSLPNLIAKANTKIDAYFLVLNQTTGNGRTIDADFYTVGARFATKPKPWDLDIEGAYQFGDRNGQDVSSFSIMSEGGYTFAKLPASPRLFVGFDYTSGDNSSSDNEYNTYNPLFSTSHGLTGYIDAFERPNIMNPTLGVDLTLLENKSYAKKVNLRAQYLAFWRADTAAGLFSGSAGSARATGGSDESFVGQEIDLLLTWQLDRHTSFMVGYSHLFAGDFINDSAAGNGGKDGDISFFYMAAQFTF